jgi:DNA-directed RNA polymerase omega subunit
MKHIALEDFTNGDEEMDSLYRLVNIAARRANQLNKPESRPLVPVPNKQKTTITALEEVLDGKVWYRVGEDDEDEYEVG